MKHLKKFYRIVFLMVFIFTFWEGASAQVLSPRRTSESMIKPSPNELPVRQNPSPELKNTVEINGIREVKVVPGEQSAKISFRAHPSLFPEIEISTEKPVPGAGGKLEFPHRLLKTHAAAIPNKNEIVPSGYTADLTELESGARYYFLITVGEGASIRQYQGKFSTIGWRTKVKVFFTELKVTNDSDDGGDGELHFQFFVNSDLFSSTDGFMDWSDEEPAITVSREYEISDASDSIELAVNGFDDDTLIVSSGLDPTGPLNGPYDSGGKEANVAKKTFNLKDFPGRNVRHDFILDSLPQIKGQGDLSFYVKGYLVIERERINR